MSDTTKHDADRSFFVYVRDTVSSKITRLAIPGDVQVGLIDNPAELQLFGRLSLVATDFSVTAANVGTLFVTNNDTIVNVDATIVPPSGRASVVLPAKPRNGQLHFIKDVSGTAGITPIDVTSRTGATIDGLLTQTISSQSGALGVYWFVNGWYILSSVSSSAFSGPIVATNGLSGSLQELPNGTSYLVAGANITIVSGSGPNGQVIISSTGGGGGGGSGADPGAQYVTINNTSSLPNERKIAAGLGITLTDGGAGGSITIAATGGFALPSISNIAVVAGIHSVDQSVFQAIGAFEFNPNGVETMSPSGSTTYTAYFQPIIEVFPTGVSAITQLYNVGQNAYVAYSLLTSSFLASTRLMSANLSGSLATGSNTYEMHMRVDVASGGANKASCRGAKLFVTWT